jgi:hypothetical protein
MPVARSERLPIFVAMPAPGGAALREVADIHLQDGADAGKGIDQRAVAQPGQGLLARAALVRARRS